MRRIVIDTDHQSADAIAAAVEVLRAGGVVAFPTDTLYGLAVDPRRPDAVGRLFALKGRDAREGSSFDFVVTVPIRQKAVISPNVMQASTPPDTTVSIWPSRIAFHA